LFGWLASARTPEKKRSLRKGGEREGESRLDAGPLHMYFMLFFFTLPQGSARKKSAQRSGEGRRGEELCHWRGGDCGWRVLGHRGKKGGGGCGREKKKREKKKKIVLFATGRYELRRLRQRARPRRAKERERKGGRYLTISIAVANADACSLCWRAWNPKPYPRDEGKKKKVLRKKRERKKSGDAALAWRMH